MNLYKLRIVTIHTPDCGECRVHKATMATITLKNKKDLMRLRRFALQAQGLLQTAPFGRGLGGARKAIDHVGYVQIDTISVVERAHHHVVRSRVPNFAPAMMDKLLKDRSIFEYWSHAAAFLPMQDYRYSLPYKHAIRSGKRHWFKNPDQPLMTDLLTRIERQGPLRSRDVEDAHNNKAGWWDWKPAKRALEQLYMQGDLMVTSREGFQKTYDLPERVLPKDIDQSMPSREEFAAHVVDQQLRCHGLVSLKGLTYYRRDAQLRAGVKALVEQRLKNGDLQQLLLPGGEKFLCRTDLLDSPTPRTTNNLIILSPFDNAVIQRERLNTLFDYDYQIECYVPEPKRRYGYFCLPLLWRDQFVGRVDCKAHRRQRRLEIKALHFDDFNKRSNTRNSDRASEAEIIQAFARALTGFAEFQNCDTVTLTNVAPAHLEATTRKAIAQHFEQI
jgi:uncharacterized protein